MVRPAGVILGTVVWLLFAAANVRAASFTDGNVVVYRVGDAVNALANAASPVFLDEDTPKGVLVQSIALPTVGSGVNRALIASGTAQSEGLISRSFDGRYILLTGYDAPLSGTVPLSTASAATVRRVIGRVDALGNVDTSTALTDASDADNVRSATSTNGMDLWVTGASGGVRYAPLGATTSTQLSVTLTNLRQLQIDNGQLFASTQAGTDIRVGTIGTGLPTSSGQSIQNLPGIGNGDQPNGFIFADLSGAVPGLDTLYVADESDGGKIQKFSLVAGTWVKNGSVKALAVRSVAALVIGSTATLFATTGGDGSP